MGEDMTYTNAGPTRAQLAARVAELERKLEDQAAVMARLMVDNVDLRAKLDAVPDYVEYREGFDEWNVKNEWPLAIDEWYAETHAPDDDTDAPPQLATVEDGDE